MSELPGPRPFHLAGEPSFDGEPLDVLDKYTGERIATVHLADDLAIDRAIAAAADAAPAMRALAVDEREAVLQHCISRFRERAEELAGLLCAEAGKPIRDARGEVTRLVDTFRFAAAELLTFGGEAPPLDLTARARGYFGVWRRFPVGPCSFIAPFNFPLNLAAHKVAPAIATGCPFVLKPASATPLTALVVGDILAETGLPRGAFSILPCHRDGAWRLCEDDRIRLLSFTGSPAVGWELKRRAGRKKVVLELGGNAAAVVDRDQEVEAVAARLVFGAFYQSGQSCISVQRVFVHADLYPAMREALVRRTRALKAGDPRDEDTFVGPMISEAEAARLEGWIRRALDAGAILLCGGERRGAMLAPTLLEGADAGLEVCAEEAFGPVAVLEPFEDFDDALRRVDAGRYGLQAGIFTRDIHRARRAWETLDVGGVVIGDVPSWRADNMPYGGVKDSGLGREGVRFAMEDMTEVRMLVLRGEA